MIDSTAWRAMEDLSDSIPKLGDEFGLEPPVAGKPTVIGGARMRQRNDIGPVVPPVLHTRCETGTLLGKMIGSRVLADDQREPQ